jgi:uncharacterized protein (DUF983 family)
MRLLRALLLRCPHCGAKAIFARWGHLRDRCPGCGYSFEREEGYWTGAMIVNIAAAQVGFLVVLLGGMALTWPGVPWGLLTGLGVAFMLLFPIWFYPRTKTLWVWLDLAVHPYSGDERNWPGA